MNKATLFVLKSFAATAFAVVVFLLALNVAFASPSPGDRNSPKCESEMIDRSYRHFPIEVQSASIRILSGEYIEHAFAERGALPFGAYKPRANIVFLKAEACDVLQNPENFSRDEVRFSEAVLLHELAHVADFRLGITDGFQYSDRDVNHSTSRSVDREIFAHCVAQYLSGEDLGCSAFQMVDTKRLAAFL